MKSTPRDSASHRIVGFIETHGQSKDSLPLSGRQRITYNGSFSRPHLVALYDMQGEGCLLLPRSSTGALLLDLGKGVASSKNRWCPVGPLSNQLGVRGALFWWHLSVISGLYHLIVNHVLNWYFLQLFNYHTYFIHTLEVLHIVLKRWHIFYFRSQICYF